MPSLFVVLQYLLPKRLLTVAAGAAARSRWLRRPFISFFMARYQIDLSEAVEQKPFAYSSFNEFFTRELKPGARPVEGDSTDPILPADGSISQAGVIEQGQLLQAKGKYYQLEQLLACSPSECQVFSEGLFSTVYLSPRDYHRVHMPLAGTLQKTCYVPGSLFSVNDTTAQGVERLFARNERLVCWFTTEIGPMAVVMVGALIVAGIEVAWAPNRNFRRLTQPQIQTFEDQTIHLSKGDELGRFFLGSTAITVLPGQSLRLQANLKAGTPVRMGQLMGTFQHASGAKS
jgi:phosphatidylserine decarboxylase